MLFFDIAIDEEGGREPFVLGPTKVWIKKVLGIYFFFFCLIGEQNEHFLSSKDVGKFRTLLLYFQQAKGKAPSV